CLNTLRGIPPTEFGREIEHGSTDDPALQCLNRELAEEGQLIGVSRIFAAGWVVVYWTILALVPGHVAPSATGCGEVVFSQQTPVVRTYEQRTVGPVADEGAIIPATLDHDMGDAQRKRAVSTRSHAQPEIRLVRRPGAAGINHNQTRASFERRCGGDRVGEPGKGRVVAPKQGAAGMLKVRHITTGNTRAEGVRRGQIPPPST